MILADTSIWIDHLRRPNPKLHILLDFGQILMHPFVLGELALGSFSNRERLLKQLYQLPQAIMISNKEVILFITKHKLFGTGIDYIDAHLLVAARHTIGAQLWTRDKRLFAASTRVGVASDMTS